MSKTGTTTEVGGIDSEEIRSLVDRIERLEEEKKVTSDDIKDIYTESKLKDYDPKIIRQVVKNRKLNQSQLDEQEAMVSQYQQALGVG